ncbi:hypothetical protein ATK36_4129 [Amycolatopsis sulphurea]|uniref:Uncharacterized protein n=1 Tax=Amycolatopsis sulphurea TaxID=76022 RepID=A0A2A9FES9_9PSEU|nr:hypothetical protein [Amycolatopsis sulphurea]PFG49010.1 hypothetical protein ATK36_4129 [Amycolatopsis sulphurea]
MTHRVLHFCGSLPPGLGDTDLDALRWFHAHTKGHAITGLPVRQDPDWTLDHLKNRIGKQPEVLRVVHAGEYRDYDDFPSYGVVPGAQLRPEHVAHGSVAEALASVETFRAYRAEHTDLADTRMMLPVPGPVDLALFTFAGGTLMRNLPNFGEVCRAVKYLPVFTEATAEFVAGVSAEAAEDVVFHLEVPSVLIGMYKARVLPGGPRAAARFLAGQMAGLLAKFPRNARVLLHLCYGDYNHTEVFQPKNLAWATMFLNHLATGLRRRHVGFPQVHIPAAFGSTVASKEDAFFAPLRLLDDEWQVIAGVASHDDSLATVAALHLFETAARRQAIGVACACGLGRLREEQAKPSVDAMITGAESAPYAA